MRKNTWDYKAYEKTQKGFLMRMYRNMKSRIAGINRKSVHLYKGKELFDKEEFYEWANCSPMFRVLFRQYQERGYPLKQAPTVDRIDSSKGYVFGNVEWVTQSVNSSRGARSKYETLSRARHAMQAG